jgi:regulatory protein
VAEGAARTAALRLLARRELSVAALRARLQDRGFPPNDIDAAIDALLESGALDDRRVARAHARTALSVKGRGRLRVLRELQQMGISQAIAAEALGEVFGEADERTLAARALEKRLRGRPKPGTPAEHARLYQYLMRQGFSHTVSLAVLRGVRAGRRDDDQE